MDAPALSERDLAILRSFASRVDPADAGAHNNLGVLYFRKGLIPEAIAQFSQALELDPKMRVAQDNLRTAYHGTGYYDRRVTELREHLRRQPEEWKARWELGRVYASLGHHDAAAAEFEALLSRYPDDVPTVIQLGLCEKAGGRIERAEEWFTRACALDRESSVARFYLGEILYNRGLNEQALTELTQAVQLNPDNAEAQYILGFVYGDLGRHEDARHATRCAIELNPTLGRAQANLSLRPDEGDGQPRPDTEGDVESELGVAEGTALAHSNLGLAFRQKGYYAEALREYRLALDQGEDRQLVLQAIAEVHLLKRDLSAALELYDRLVDEYPDSPKLWNERGVCLQQAGRRDAAIESYKRAIDVDEAYALAWNNRGVAEAQVPDLEAASDAFREALRHKPDLVSARLNFALLLFQRRRFQLALEAFRHALTDAPDHAVAWNGVGLVLMELKRFADAKNAFSRAVEADPDHAAAHYNLSFSLSQLGDFDGALRETKRALELEPYYVPQKYDLTIDLQYEHPTISVAPLLSADEAAGEMPEDFVFDERLLDDLFAELAPPVAEMDKSESGPGRDLSLALARDYISKGLLELASAELNRARRRGASAAQAAVLQGDIFAKRGLHGEALERYREAKEVDHHDIGALVGEVQTLLALSRVDEALQSAADLQPRASGNVEALVACAKVRVSVGELVSALDCLKEAQTVTPTRPDLYQLQAQVAVRLGDLEAASDAYGRALTLDPNLVMVWYEVGRLEESRGDWAAARAAHTRALDLLPTFMDAALALADGIRRHESSRQAVLYLVGILAMEPYDFEALVLLGRSLFDDGRPDRSIEAYDRVLRFIPNHADALYFRGLALERERRLAEAVESWHQAIQSNPAGQYAQAARLRMRSARDLSEIFDVPQGVPRGD
jgi:tetratricopeptide (TPR) repeat protein